MRKTLLKKIGFYVQTILSLVLIGLVFIVGWKMAFTSIDLNKSKQMFGIVNSIERQQTKGSKAIPGQRDLIVTIESINTGFWIYRSSQNYDDLIRKLAQGKTIKIYFDVTTGSNNYFTIYQIEDREGIIYSKDEYEKKEKMAGRFIALPGAILMFYLLYRDVRKRLWLNV